MIYISWIANNRALIMAGIALLGFFCQILYFRHRRDGRMQPNDLGYFWRLWQQGDRDGTLMIYLTFAGIMLAIILIVSILINARL